MFLEIKKLSCSIPNIENVIYISRLYIIAPLMPPQQKLHVALFVQKQRPQSGRGVVTFRTKVTEVGGQWNSVANNFILPVQGMYYFHLTVVSVRRDGRSGAHIRVDNRNVQVAFAPVHMSTGSASVVMRMNRYAQVSAWMTEGTVGGRGQNGYYTHMNGFLLYRM